MLNWALHQQTAQTNGNKFLRYCNVCKSVFSEPVSTGCILETMQPRKTCAGTSRTTHQVMRKQRSPGFAVFFVSRLLILVEIFLRGPRSVSHWVPFVVSYRPRRRSAVRIRCYTYFFCVNSSVFSAFRVSRTQMVGDDFHGRFAAKGRTYIYRLGHLVHPEPETAAEAPWVLPEVGRTFIVRWGRVGVDRATGRTCTESAGNLIWIRTLRDKYCALR